MQPDTPALELDGSLVPLRFTWSTLDALGTSGVTEMLERARSPEPGALGMLANLIVAAAQGAVTQEQVLAASPPLAEALSAVLTAYLYAMHGEPELEAPPPAQLAPQRAPWWRRVAGRA